MDKYDSLIEKWVESKERAGLAFSHDDSPMGAGTIIYLFNEQIAKRTLARMCCCIGSAKNTLSKDGDEHAKIVDILKPFYSKAVVMGYEYEPITSEEERVLEEIPPKLFSGWLVLMLNRDVLPNASHLENVFVTEAF